LLGVRKKSTYFDQKQRQPLQRKQHTFHNHYTKISMHSVIILHYTKAACIPLLSWGCYGMHSICIRHKWAKRRNFYLANHMSLSIWNSILWSLFSTQLTHNMLTFRRNLVPHEEVLPSLPCLWRLKNSVI
jgi:hypothetical protein